MQARYWHLQRCDLFRQLTAEEISWLESHSYARDYARRTVIYLPAQAADAVLLVSRGRVRLSHLLPNGRQAILAFVQPGELFGELSLMQAGSQTARRDEQAETVEASTIVLIPRDAMWKLMKQHPTVSIGVTRLLGFRRQRIERRLTSLLFRDVRQRLACLLVEYASEQGVGNPSTARPQLRFSHQDLADLIGSSRETVTLTLGEFQRHQFLQLGRQRITLCDLPGLQEIVGSGTAAQPVGKTGNRTENVSKSAHDGSATDRKAAKGLGNS